jgi:hypothetical protein
MKQLIQSGTAADIDLKRRAPTYRASITDFPEKPAP